MKLGLKDPIPGAVKLRFATYANYRTLPTPPAQFGHENLINTWGVLGNDNYGDCAVAGPCHQSMLWCAESGTPAPFSDTSVLANYSAITGFDPNDPDTDQGTAIGDMAKYWRNTGMADDTGHRHRIVAYLDLNPGDLREMLIACWLFQSVGLGFDLPASAQEQFADGEVWDVVPGSPIVGGHYVPAVARRDGMTVGVTWGNEKDFTDDFFTTFNNQGIVALSHEMMIKGRSIDGFDDQLLHSDLAAFR